VWIEHRLKNFRKEGRKVLTAVVPKRNILVVTSLSGVIGSGTVPDFQNMAATLDPIIAKALTHFSSTLPGGLTLVHTMYGLLCTLEH
jgi:hypothetical protein